MKIRLITGILAVNVLTNLDVIEVIQRIMINDSMCYLCSAHAVPNCTHIYWYCMNIIGKAGTRKLLDMGLRGGAAPRA